MPRLHSRRVLRDPEYGVRARSSAGCYRPRTSPSSILSSREAGQLLTNLPRTKVRGAATAHVSLAYDMHLSVSEREVTP